MVGKESRECPHFWWMAGEDTEGPIGGQDRNSAQDALCLGGPDIYPASDVH